MKRICKSIFKQKVFINPFFYQQNNYSGKIHIGTSTLGQLVLNPKQSTNPVNFQHEVLKKIACDEKIDENETVIYTLVLRKLWFRLLLEKYSTYDSKVCFLGVGEDTIYKCYKNCICVDLNKDDHIITMNIEEKLDEFCQLLLDNEIEILYSEGCFKYVKPEYVRKVIEFCNKNDIKMIFDFFNKKMMDYNNETVLMGNTLFYTCAEDVEDLCKNFQKSTTGDRLKFLGVENIDDVEGVDGRDYIFYHNFE